MYALNAMMMLHPGHGMPAGHFHTGDTMAFFLLIVTAIFGIALLTDGGRS